MAHGNARHTAYTLLVVIDGWQIMLKEAVYRENQQQHAPLSKDRRPKHMGNGLVRMIVG